MRDRYNDARKFGYTNGLVVSCTVNPLRSSHNTIRLYSVPACVWHLP